MTSKTAPQDGTDLATQYEPTSEERVALAAYFAREKRKPPAPRIKLTDQGGAIKASADHLVPSVGQALVMQALGTADADFFHALLNQLVKVGTQGEKLDEHGLNFMLAMVKGIAPKDQVDAMLAVQMVAVHNATMVFAGRLAHADNVAQQDIAERALNKLARTFAVQTEALKRYRTGGEQRVTVQHVTVNEGGQAIVGAVSAVAGGGGGPKNREAAP